MSFDSSYKCWVATTHEIAQLLKKQEKLKKIEPPETKDISFKIFSELYVLYVDLVNKLSFIYFNTFQVQKREVVRKLVESATKQLMLLKEELKDMEISEYVYIDKVLVERKLTPHDLMIWRSPQFLFRRPLDIQNIIAENKLYMNDEQKEELAAKDWRKVSEAVELIQAHERARSSRVYKSNITYDKKKFLEVKLRRKINYRFTFKANQAMSIPVKRTVFNVDYIKNDESCAHLKHRDGNVEDGYDDNELRAYNEARNNAASVIQSWWRTYKTRKIYKLKKQFRLEMMGMLKTRQLKRPSRFSNSVLEMYENEKLKARLDEDYLKLIMDERTRLLQVRTPWMMEDISDHIRAWFAEFYEKTSNFHAYPDPIKKGTILVVRDETMTPMEFQESMNKKPMSKEEKKKLAAKKRAEKRKIKEKAKLNKLKEEKRRKKLKDAGVIDVAYIIGSSPAIAKMEKTLKRFSIEWRNIDEYLNKRHEAIKDWITNEQMDIIHQELRLLVDEYMRIEYELLREALAQDNDQPYSPLPVKYAKAKKGRKKKKPVDPTGDRTLDSLYHELKDAGVIEQVSHKDFDDFIADFNFLADSARDEENLTTVGPAKGDIKMVIQESMMGMSEFDIDKPKAILLIGPLNCGKKLLCNIIASELDAVFMNLSPEKVVQFASDMNMFLHIVMKVAKAFQPTIFYIQEAERVFLKKQLPELKSIQPGLLGPYIGKKILKGIKNTDKMVLLATSSEPWAAKAPFKNLFQKTLLIPKSDYGTSFLLWLDLMTQNAPNEMEGYMFSALARILQSYTSGDVTQNIAATLNVDRQRRLQSEKLNPHEFLEFFLSTSDPPVFPPDEKTMEKFTKWFASSDKFGKIRAQLIALKTAKKK